MARAWIRAVAAAGGQASGTCAPPQPGAAIGDGTNAVALQNRNGVALVLIGAPTGVTYTPAVEGIEVKLP